MLVLRLFFHPYSSHPNPSAPYDVKRACYLLRAGKLWGQHVVSGTGLLLPVVHCVVLVCRFSTHDDVVLILIAVFLILKL
jgi:hypothetical protein